MKRRGKTLVELLVVISMFGVIIGTSGTVIYRLMRAERAVEADLVWQRTVTELAEQFRADAHAATVAQTNDDGTGLTFTLSDGTAAYTLTRHGVRRSWKSPGGQEQHQDFRCHEPDIRFAARQDGPRSWVHLVIPRSSAALAKTVGFLGTPTLEVRAVVGRFVLPPKKEGVS